MVTIHEIMRVAKDHGASDVHITVGVPPKIRRHGSIINTDFNVMMPADTEVLLKSIMNEIHLKTFQEKGEVDYSFSIEEFGRYRVNVYSQRGSMAAAIRLVASEPPNPAQLGLPYAVTDLYKKKRGLILVTGPTGSGKSTTLASVIGLINDRRTEHIITLEDPIEYLHRHKGGIVNQREVGIDTLSYANALRAALRQDPDVILVGEMRDLETISTAITAAETGHLVLSTLHTIGAAPTIDRAIDVFPPHQQQQIRVQLASVLEAVISQQIMPKADGKGRVAAFEILLANPAIRNLIREGKTHQINSMIQTNKGIGMTTMDDSIYELYQNGYISLDTAITYATDPLTLQKKLGSY